MRSYFVPRSVQPLALTYPLVLKYDTPYCTLVWEAQPASCLLRNSSQARQQVSTVRPRLPREPILIHILVVTGSSKANGIGAAIAFALAEQGANVSTARHPGSKMLAVADSRTRSPSTTAHPPSPPTKSSPNCKAWASAPYPSKLMPLRHPLAPTSSQLHSPYLETSHIDIVVNNAGAAAVHPTIADVPISAWDELFHANVRAPFLLIQAALPYIPSGGRIINIGSIVAKMGNKMLTVYSASKGALTSALSPWLRSLGRRALRLTWLRLVLSRRV